MYKKAEIPVEILIQLEDDSAFLNELASQSTHQVSGSKTGSDIDSTSTVSSICSDISGAVFSESDSDEGSPVVRHRKHFKNSTRHNAAST